MKKYFLFEGQFLITTAEVEITTVLGSCVSVCLWDETLRMAGINHYLLPGNEQDDAGNPSRGLSSTRMVINAMMNRKAEPGRMMAKVFGGANSLNTDRHSIGSRNVDVAFRILNEFKIPVVAKHTGGMQGRKIVYNTQSGKVRMQLLNKPFTQVNEEINKGFGY